MQKSKNYGRWEEYNEHKIRRKGVKITTEDNLENCPICGEGTPGGTVRCACCQRQLDIENMTEADYRAYEA